MWTKEEVKTWGRAKQAAAFAKGGARLQKALRKFPRKMWSFSKDPKNWSIAEILWHLADHEANFYVRLRKAAAEPGGPVRFRL